MKWTVSMQRNMLRLIDDYYTELISGNNATEEMIFEGLSKIEHWKSLVGNNEVSTEQVSQALRELSREDFDGSDLIKSENIKVPKGVVNMTDKPTTEYRVKVRKDLQSFAKFIGEQMGINLQQLYEQALIDYTNRQAEVLGLPNKFSK